MNATDLVGKKYGRLFVLRANETKVNHRGQHVYVDCKCDCGNICTADYAQLIDGRTKSCGCFRRDRIAKQNTRHNASRTRLYSIYYQMKKRCYYKSHISYPKYGGIGISVCEEWKRDFTAFQNWALENGYDDTKQIDRIDVNGNYEPANCRWVSRKENMRNRHNTVFVSYDGKLVPFVELCETFGVKEGNARAFFRNHNRDEAQLISYLKRKANV